jgi:MFS family permease
MQPRFAPLAVALLLVAVTVGLPIPGLRLIVVDEFGQGGLTAGAYAGLHVAGTILGSWLWGLWLHRRRGDLALRPMLRLALAGSGVLLITMGFAPSLVLLLVLRFLDGVVHVGIVMLLMGSGAHGGIDERARRMGWLGSIMVLGVGAGLALGGQVATYHPRAVFFVAALCVGVASQLIANAIPQLLSTTPESSAMSPSEPPALGGAVIGPMALVGVERLAMGVLTVALPFGIETQRTGFIGAVLGSFMTASVIAMPLTHLAHRRFGATATCHTSALGLALSLMLVSHPLVLSGPVGYLWAALSGLCAGALFMSGLLLISLRADLRVRMRALGLVHAAGAVGHAIGSFGAGFALTDGSLSAPRVASIFGSAAIMLGWVGFALVRERARSA